MDTNISGELAAPVFKAGEDTLLPSYSTACCHT